MRLRTVKDADVCERRVLMRADYNVPLARGKIADDSRIRANLPTLKLLLDGGARVAVCTHLGRPKGRPSSEFRVDPVAAALGELLGCDVPKADDCVGDPVRDLLDRMNPGGVAMLENVRFHADEEANVPSFAKALAEPFDLFVNDAFGTTHRAHASTTGVTQYLPAYAGLLVEREVHTLSVLIDNPRRPYYVVVGGKKAKDKIGVLTDLLGKVDAFLVGGGVAFTFLKAQGHQVGDSLVDDELVETLGTLLAEAKNKGTKIMLPSDVVIAPEPSASHQARVCPSTEIPEGWMGLDIGPDTVNEYAAMLEGAGSVVWAGPMGAFEWDAFAQGTRSIARVLAGIKGFTVVGGGETGEAVSRLGLERQFGHLSTGGGATLAFLRGTSMPALEALRDDGRS